MKFKNYQNNRLFKLLFIIIIISLTLLGIYSLNNLFNFEKKNNLDLNSNKVNLDKSNLQLIIKENSPNFVEDSNKENSKENSIKKNNSNQDIKLLNCNPQGMTTDYYDNYQGLDTSNCQSLKKILNHKDFQRKNRIFDIDTRTIHKCGKVKQRLDDSNFLMLS